MEICLICKDLKDLLYLASRTATVGFRRRRLLFNSLNCRYIFIINAKTTNNHFRIDYFGGLIRIREEIELFSYCLVWKFTFHIVCLRSSAIDDIRVEDVASRT